MKNRKFKVALLALVILAAILCTFVLKISISEMKYNSIKENTTGKEITVIAEEYVNANIKSAVWNENILECVKQDSVKKGMFAGSLNKQYFVFSGKNEGKTEIEFIIDKYGSLYRKTYLVAVSADLTVTVMSTEMSVIEDKNVGEESDSLPDSNNIKDEAEQTDSTTNENYADNLYSETINSINGLDDYTVNGCEIVYIDNDDVPEIIASVDYYGDVLFIYSIKDGCVAAYDVCSEWFTVDDPLDSGVANGLDLGNGTASQIKEFSYLPYSGKFLYEYKETDDAGNIIEIYYYSDGTEWKEVSQDFIDRDLESGWTKIYFIY